MAKPQVWLAHAELCKIYGDVVHLRVLGHDIVLLGSREAIVELLEKRSLATSVRQETILAELSGQDFNMALMTYAPRWKLHRRLFVQQFATTISDTQMSFQRQYARLCLKKVLNDPDKLAAHLRYTFGASVVRSVYGIEVAESNDENIALMETATDGVEALTPGRFLVQFMPILEHAPHWLPIIGPQMKKLSVWRECSKTVRVSLFNMTKDALARGEAPPSMVGNILRDLEDADPKDIPEIEQATKEVAMSAFEGALETTSSTLQFFYVAMWLNPEVQRKAQAELDAVVGPHRLPVHADRDSLPYISAIVRECLRWHPVLPFAVPHYSSEDMEYRGYFIPKHTTMVPVSWAILHDPAVFPEPERFIPERFIRDGKLYQPQREVEEFAFGYGRRRCPGLAYGESAVFINIAMTLHAFNILPPLDKKTGQVVTAEPEVVGLFTAYPDDCRCRVELRFPDAESLIYADD
ncbi:CyP450 monooxygenase [Daedaleopsis nitida]|nr:CyP450 monooxygenase [Daedaleopsis nitida]